MRPRCGLVARAIGFPLPFRSIIDQSMRRPQRTNWYGAGVQSEILGFLSPLPPAPVLLSTHVNVGLVLGMTPPKWQIYAMKKLSLLLRTWEESCFFQQLLKINHLFILKTSPNQDVSSWTPYSIKSGHFVVD
jgi:hypothetical protein